MIQYQLNIDLAHDGTFSDSQGVLDLTVLSVAWTIGMRDSFSQVSRPIRASIEISDPALAFSQDRAVSPFGVPLHDKLVRLQATVNGQPTRTLLTGWITNVQSSDRAFGAVSVITIEDQMLKLQDAEYLPMFDTNVRLDDEIRNVFASAVIAYPYLRAHWILGHSRLGIETSLFSEQFTELDVAVSTLAFVGDAADRGQGVSALGYIMDLLASEKGGRFFVNRDGKFHFHNRYHDKLDTYSDTFTDTDYLEFDLVQGEVFNEFTVNYIPRTLGIAGTVLYTAKNVPFQLQALERKEIRGRYYSPDIENATIGGMDMIEPIPGTDYEASIGGDNRNAALRWNFELGGTGVRILIDNPTNEVITISKLQVRGTPVLTYQQEAVTKINGESLYKYGRIPFPPVEARFINTETEASAYANNLKARYGEPQQRYEAITMDIGSLDGSRDVLAERVLAKEVGDIIRVTNSITGHDRVYAIVGESHTLSGQSHRVRWVLRPTERVIAWILGQSQLGVDTHIAF